MAKKNMMKIILALLSRLKSKIDFNEGDKRSWLLKWKHVFGKAGAAT